ncbi:MAG: hypothetical protein ACRCVJ_12470 [Clostridium sp.]|uniref:hypothetical protein n=1 Tax=Clostridium sp. TaxID=1506 RepID=UPI003F3F109C
MARKDATYRIDNGSDWDEIMFETTAEQVKVRNLPLSNFIFKNVIGGTFSTAKGTKLSHLVIPHKLGHTPYFIATAICVSFAGSISIKREVALPVTYRFNNESDYANITISADGDNFYLELARSGNLAANNWFEHIQYAIRYTD